MSDLLLSPNVLLQFEGLKNMLPHGEFVDEKLDVKVKFENIAIGMIQSDRYDVTINCYIEILNYKIKFLLQDLVWALGGEVKGDESSENSFATALNENDSVANDFVEFCVNNTESLAAWPPPWFLAASAHATEALSEHFPELAEQIRTEHRRAWSSMIGESRQRE